MLALEASKQKGVRTYTRETGTASHILPMLRKIVMHLKGDLSTGCGNGDTIHKIKKRQYNKKPGQFSKGWPRGILEKLTHQAHTQHG